MAITTTNRLGTWDDVFAAAGDEVQAIAHHLRSLITNLHGDATEVPRKGDRAVSYGYGEKKMSESYCYLMPQKDRVNIGFWWGIALPDPEGLLEGTGKKLRHVKIYDMATAKSAKIASLISMAMSERRTALADKLQQRGRG